MTTKITKIKTTKRHPAFTKKAIASYPTDVDMNGHSIQQLAREAVAFETLEVWEKTLPAGHKSPKGVTLCDELVQMHVIRLINAKGEKSYPFAMMKTSWGMYLCLYAMSDSLVCIYAVTKAKGYQRIS